MWIKSGVQLSNLTRFQYHRTQKPEVDLPDKKPVYSADPNKYKSVNRLWKLDDSYGTASGAREAAIR